jgi:HSP20 family molecular chaperone IbpA
MPAVDIHEYADRFELLVDLPDTVDSKKVRATGSNGVLEISTEGSASADICY